MDKDSQGIDRAKCACGEYQEFEENTGVSCSFCGCPPARRAKLTATKSSQTSDASSIIHEVENVRH